MNNKKTIIAPNGEELINVEYIPDDTQPEFEVTVQLQTTWGGSDKYPPHIVCDTMTKEETEVMEIESV